MKLLPAQFEDHAIRRIYDEETDTWWFSVVDIVQVLTQQPDFQTSRKYWNKLKERLVKEGSQLVTNCHQLKMAADDGEQRLTDVATAQFLATAPSHQREEKVNESETRADHIDPALAAAGWGSI